MKTTKINYFVAGFCAAAALATGLDGSYALMTLNIAFVILNIGVAVFYDNND